MYDGFIACTSEFCLTSASLSNALAHFLQGIMLERK